MDILFGWLPAPDYNECLEVSRPILVFMNIVDDMWLSSDIKRPNIKGTWRTKCELGARFQVVLYSEVKSGWKALIVFCTYCRTSKTTC